MGIVVGHRGDKMAGLDTFPRGETFERLNITTMHKCDRRDDARPIGSNATEATFAVLVVDDEEDVLEVTAEILADSGLRVYTARDALEARRVFQAHRHEIDAVVLDLSLPCVSGVEVFHELRRMRGDVRVILSSGFDKQYAISRFDEADLAGFLQKPYLSTTLIKMVYGVVAN